MIKRKDNGRWWLYMLDEHNAPVRKTFEKKADAVAMEAIIKQRKYEARLVKVKLRKKRHTIEKAMSDFEISKSDTRPATQKRYKSIINEFRNYIEALGITYVDEFTPDHGRDLLRELKKEKLDPTGSTQRVLKAKPKTINMFLQVVKSIFRQELENEHIDRDPMMRIKYLKVEERDADFYTSEELNLFFSERMPEAYRNAFLGFLYTGMRFSELANLTWDNVDFSARRVHVRPSGHFMPKSKTSIRSIPMGADLVDLLVKIKDNTQMDLVFPSTEGKMLKERKTLAMCKAVASRAGVRSNAFIHKFRHTYATILVRMGVRLEDIKALLGHSSIEETERYAHHSPEDLHDKVANLDNIFNKRPF